MNNRQAYKAMLLFLEKYYMTAPSDDLAVLLGDMQLTKDGLPHDQALWDEWIHATRRSQNESRNPNPS